jgi:hypothetical protein
MDSSTPWPPRFSESEVLEWLEHLDELYFSHIRQGVKYLSVPGDVLSDLRQLRKKTKDQTFRQRINDMLAVGKTTAVYHWDLQAQLPLRNRAPFFVWSGEDENSRTLYIRDEEKEYSLGIELGDRTGQGREGLPRYDVLSLYQHKVSGERLLFHKGALESIQSVGSGAVRTPVLGPHEAILTWEEVMAPDHLMYLLSQSNLTERFKTPFRPLLEALATYPQRTVAEMFPAQKEMGTEGLLRSVLFATRTR